MTLVQRRAALSTLAHCFWENTSSRMPPTTTEEAGASDSGEQNKIGDDFEYWSAAASDVDSMLGGYAHISPVELQGSRAFLAKLGIGLQAGRRRVTNALEGGAG